MPTSQKRILVYKAMQSRGGVLIFSFVSIQVVNVKFGANTTLLVASVLIFVLRSSALEPVHSESPLPRDTEQV